MHVSAKSSRPRKPAKPRPKVSWPRLRHLAQSKQLGAQKLAEISNLRRVKMKHESEIQQLKRVLNCCRKNISELEKLRYQTLPARAEEARVLLEGDRDMNALRLDVAALEKETKSKDAKITSLAR